MENKTSKYKWPLSIIVVVIIIIVLIVGRGSEEKKIKIGVIAPLKAGATIYGENLVKGIELAQADLGVEGQKYQLIVEDDEGNIAKSASAAQKLINIDGVRVIISVTSGTGNTVQKIAGQYGVTHICDCVDTSIATGTGFIYSVLPQVESESWLKEAKARGIKDVYLITQNHPGANLIREEVMKNASKYGVNIVGDTKIEGTQRDFKTDVVKLKSVKADMYFAIVFPPTLDILAKEMKSQNISNYSSVGLLAITSDLSVFEGNWYTDNYLADVDYMNKFTKQNPSLRFNARTAPHGYDIFNMIVKGQESGNITNYLRDLNEYSGKVGVAKKSGNQNTFSLPVGIWEIKNSTPVQLKQVE
jgi:ABC-type branched-subunit amino acid transport system substrate-binding protein